MILVELPHTAVAFGCLFNQPALHGDHVKVKLLLAITTPLHHHSAQGSLKNLPVPTVLGDSISKLSGSHSRAFCTDLKEKRMRKKVLQQIFIHTKFVRQIIKYSSNECFRSDGYFPSRLTFSAFQEAQAYF